MEVENPRTQAFDQIDDATAALILRLQSEDVEELQSSSKGKRREGEVPDAELAMIAFQEELDEMNTIFTDRSMSRSLTRAVITDSALLVDAIAKEDTLANDRAVAERLSHGEDTAGCDEDVTEGSSLDDLFIARLMALYISGSSEYPMPSAKDAEGVEPTSGESSEWAAARGEKPRSKVTHHECTSCNERKPLFEMFRTPCGHFYCQECLSTLFQLSTQDETLFPPRCCRQGIPLASARLYLSPGLVKEFQKKSVEFRTSNRTYCSRPTCSSFITPENINREEATCTACYTTTCTICKGNAHKGDCPEDTATQQVLEAAREEGWQRCYNCRRLVELNFGCNHMTCPCSAQFCYVCGERWKTCPCDQWVEARLEARAEQVVAREQPRIPAAPEVVLAQVQQAVAALREGHNCEHQNWRFIRGPNQCEECQFNLPQYIFECRQCRIRACNRCKRNRL